MSRKLVDFFYVKMLGKLSSKMLFEVLKKKGPKQKVLLIDILWSNVVLFYASTLRFLNVFHFVSIVSLPLRYEHTADLLYF